MAAETVRRAVTLFNRQEYFAAHELLEDVWRDASEQDRSLYDAIIRIATALHLRTQRGGGSGCVNLLQQALLRIDDLRPSCAGVDTAALYADVSAYLERIRRAGPVTWLERRRLPRIHLAAATR